MKIRTRHYWFALLFCGTALLALVGRQVWLTWQAYVLVDDVERGRDISGMNSPSVIDRRLYSFDRIQYGDPTPAIDTAFLAAVRVGRSDYIAQFIAAGSSIEQRDEWGLTPLMVAARFDHVDIMKVLIAAGADVNARDVRKCTALHWAAGFASPEAVEVLLRAGATRGLGDGLGRTPSAWAQDRKNETGATIQQMISAPASR